MKSRGRPAHDLTGQKFARLTVLRMAQADGQSSRAYCRCDCGGSKIVRSWQLRSGEVKSCGCLRREKAAANMAAARRAARMAGTLSASGKRAARMATIDAILPPRAEPAHADRPGARVVRGSRY